MLALVLFMFDYVASVVANHWVVSSLLAYFICLCWYKREWTQFHTLAFALLLVQDYACYERLGFGLVYLLPLIGGIRLVKLLVHRYWFGGLSLLTVVIFYAFEFFFVKRWLFAFTEGCALNTLWKSTFSQMVATLIIMILIILFGTRGNRFLAR